MSVFLNSVSIFVKGFLLALRGEAVLFLLLSLLCPFYIFFIRINTPMQVSIAFFIALAEKLAMTDL
jgi:hypothetical protein